MAAADIAPAQQQTAKDLLFGFTGRAGRLQFWLVMIAASAVFGLFWSMVNLKSPVDPTAPPPPRPPGSAILEAMPWIIARDRPIPRGCRP